MSSADATYNRTRRYQRERSGKTAGIGLALPVDSIGGNLQSVPTIQTLLKCVASPATGEPDTSLTGRQTITISTSLSRSLTSLPEIIFRAESVATEHLKREIGNCKFDGRTNRD